MEAKVGLVFFFYLKKKGNIVKKLNVVTELSMTRSPA